jgi:hypothetical protein
MKRLKRAAAGREGRIGSDAAIFHVLSSAMTASGGVLVNATLTGKICTATAILGKQRPAW